MTDIFFGNNMPSKYVPETKCCDPEHDVCSKQNDHMFEKCAEDPKSSVCCTLKSPVTSDTLKEYPNTMDDLCRYEGKDLSYVSDNSRSQSLPNCFYVTVKSQQYSEGDCKQNDDSVDILNEKSKVFGASNPTKQDYGKLNNAWFKTWPERGNEKAVTSNLSSNDTRCDDYEDSVHNELCNLYLCANRGSPRTESCESNICVKSIRSECQEATGRAVGQSYTPHSKIVPSCSCDNSNLRRNFRTSETCSSTNSVPLTEILQNIPIAYSPITRQLHIIKAEESQATLNSVKTLVCRSCLCPSNNEMVLNEGNVSINFGCDVNAKCAPNGVLEDTISYESPCSTLQRVGAHETCPSHTDESSFSSIVSSLSDNSPSTNEDTTVGNTTDHNVHSLGSYDDVNFFEEDKGAKLKRKGISSFFTRGVFLWRRDSTGQGCSQSGWRLWGTRSSGSVSASGVAASEDDAQGDPKQFGDVIASSSALILHQRPSNLPAKCPDEELKHRHEYQRMVEAARKKELREAKLRKKQLAQQLRQEEQLAQAARVWSTEILPKWDLMKSSRKARDLWWQGLPPSVRGRVWRLAIGNELNITPQLYDICVARAQERLRAAAEELQQQQEQQNSLNGGDSPDKEASVELIQLDIARTFPNLCIFQRGGPYYDILHSLLGAYVCYRPDVGYVQGMSFIAAVLILNLEPHDAFICFANLLNQPCHMAFFRLNQTVMQAYYSAYDSIFRENLPRLHAHFSSAHLSADLYLLDWLYTVFAKAMPLDVACRVWDVFLRDGEEFLFKTALGVLHLHQETLMQLDFLHGAQFLTKLPDDLAADKLFRSIESIRMTVGKLRFSEVLALHVEPS